MSNLGSPVANRIRLIVGASIAFAMSRDKAEVDISILPFGRNAIGIKFSMVESAAEYPRYMFHELLAGVLATEFTFAKNCQLFLICTYQHRRVESTLNYWM